MATHEEAGNIARKNQASSISFTNGSNGETNGTTSTVRAMSPEAKRVSEKNKAQGGNWFRHDAKDGATGDRPVSRHGSEEAEKIASKSRQGVNWYRHDDNMDYTAPAHTPRCNSDEAKESYEKSKGSLGHMFSPEKSNGSPTKAVSRITEEGQKAALKNRGQMEEIIGSSPTPLSAKFKRRVKPEAEANFNRNKGSYGGLLSGSNSSGDDRPHSRLTHEAEANFIRNKGTMTGIFGSQENSSPKGTPSKRGVTAENKEYVDRSRGTVSDLFNSYGKLDRPKKPMDRVRPEARRTADKMRQDHVSEIMSPR